MFHPILLLCTWKKYTVITTSGMTVQNILPACTRHQQSGYGQRFWFTTTIGKGGEQRSCHHYGKNGHLRHHSTDLHPEVKKYLAVGRGQQGMGSEHRCNHLASVKQNGEYTPLC